MRRGDIARLKRCWDFGPPPWVLFEDARLSEGPQRVLEEGDVVLILDPKAGNGICHVAAPRTGSVGYIEVGLLKEL